ncbi:MAG: hypothetical protein HKN60_04430 [Rhizobiales bacterium]|nr:hypothetical protein [Hyphomicrobiales bacterium]
MEKAIASFNRALTVITPDNDLTGWMTVNAELALVAARNELDAARR